MPFKNRMLRVSMYHRKPLPTVLCSLVRLFWSLAGNHSDLSTKETLDSFTTLIGGGIDKGFKEAKDILEGLNVLKEGNIGSNIDATYALVRKGLQAFVENYKDPAITESDTSA